MPQTELKKAKKIAIMGAGNIGTELWKEITEQGLAESVYLWNQPESDRGKSLSSEKFKGTQKAVDQANIIRMREREGTSLGNTSQFKFSVTENYEEALKDADIVIVTAGQPRKPGDKRSDLLNKNCPIIDPIAEATGFYAPNATCIVGTNPVDTLTQRFAEKSGLPKEKVIGLSGELDYSRMVQSICENLKVPPSWVKGAKVVGQHGDYMVPVFSQTTILDNDLEVPLTDKCTPAMLEKIKTETVGGGGVLVKLLGTSDHIAPAAALLRMTKAVLGSGNTIFGSAYSPEHELFIGREVKFDDSGRYETLPMPRLNISEKGQFAKAVEDCGKAMYEVPGAESPALQASGMKI
jgi:malate dehydrogenase